jgi:hypothetical protein
MFIWLRRQGLESSVNKVFQKEKLVNSKTKKIYSPLKEVSSAGANLVQMSLKLFSLSLAMEQRKLKWLLLESYFRLSL